MNCYNHQDRPAVGICKNCNKGLCRDCAVDVGNGLACKDSCEEEVRAINDMTERGKTAYHKASKAHNRNAIIYGLMGSVFLFWGILVAAFSDDATAAFFLIPFGVIFLIGTFLSARSGRQIGQIGE